MKVLTILLTLWSLLLSTLTFAVEHKQIRESYNLLAKNYKVSVAEITEKVKKHFSNITLEKSMMKKLFDSPNLSRDEKAYLIKYLNPVVWKKIENLVISYSHGQVVFLNEGKKHTISFKHYLTGVLYINDKKLDLANYKTHIQVIKGIEGYLSGESFVSKSLLDHIITPSYALIIAASTLVALIISHEVFSITLYDPINEKECRKKFKSTQEGIEAKLNQCANDFELGLSSVPVWDDTVAQRYMNSFTSYFLSVKDDYTNFVKNFCENSLKISSLNIYPSVTTFGLTKKTCNSESEIKNICENIKKLGDCISDSKTRSDLKNEVYDRSRKEKDFNKEELQIYNANKWSDIKAK